MQKIPEYSEYPEYSIPILETNMEEAGFPVGHRNRWANFLSLFNLAGQKTVVCKNAEVAFVNLPWNFMRSWRAHLDTLLIKLFNFVGFEN